MKILNKLCFWKTKEEKHIHTWEKVRSTEMKHGETIEKIVNSLNNKDLSIMHYGSIKYRDRYVYLPNTCWEGKTIYNQVCIECGECNNVHKNIENSIVYDMKRIDEDIEREELAEKVWKDNCMES